MIRPGWQAAWRHSRGVKRTLGDFMQFVGRRPILPAVACQIAVWAGYRFFDLSGKQAVLIAAAAYLAFILTRIFERWNEAESAQVIAMQREVIADAKRLNDELRERARRGTAEHTCSEASSEFLSAKPFGPSWCETWRCSDCGREFVVQVPF